MTVKGNKNLFSFVPVPFTTRSVRRIRSKGKDSLRSTTRSHTHRNDPRDYYVIGLRRGPCSSYAPRTGNKVNRFFMDKPIVTGRSLIQQKEPTGSKDIKWKPNLTKKDLRYSSRDERLTTEVQLPMVMS